MRPHQKKSPPGDQLGRDFTTEETQRHDSAALASEAHEARIRQLGEQMVAAISAGNRAAALRFQEQMFAAIKARPPEEIQRRQAEIDRAIEASRSTFVCAMPGRRAA